MIIMYIHHVIFFRQLDQASLSARSQNLSPRREKSAQAFAEQTTNCAMEIADRIDSVRSAAKGEAEKLGHAVSIKHFFKNLFLILKDHNFNELNH